MSRTITMALALGVLAGCAGSGETITSSEVDPTREFDVNVPDVDTDWPLGLDTDTDMGDTDTDMGDTDTDR